MTMLPHDDTGTGPALLLLHAGVGDRTMWSEHLSPLADAGFRVVAPDLPGFGEAPVAPPGRAPWDDVLATMDGLGIERAALVGNSFGANVALRIAVLAPERVDALVLVSALAPGLTPSERLDAAWEAEGEALERGDVEAAVRAVVEAWTLPDAPEQLRDRVAAMQRRALALQLELDEEAEPPDPVEEHPDSLTRVTAPTLLAAGEADMPDFRVSVETLADTMPRARAAVIAGAGHLAPLETPTAFRELLLGFLAELR